MNATQATQIRDYGKVPITRDEGLDIIRRVGYTRLNGNGGRRPINLCPDEQVISVAKRLYDEAIRYNEVKPSKEELRIMAEESALRIPDNTKIYRGFLLERLALDPTECDLGIGELEQQLCG